MNEAQWLASGAPGKMLEHLPTCGSPRKRRLFGCGCCRRIWNLLSDERSRVAVQVAELFADGEVTPDRLDSARRDAALAYQKARVFVRNGNMFGAGRAVRPKPMSTYKAFGTGACLCAAGVDPYSSSEEPEGPSILDWQDAAETAMEAGAKWHVELSAICGLLRDVFGNPFRPIAFSPQWRSATAVSVARQMYEAHDFAALPELADALQDARCDNADILDHCRGPGPHVRGCWVVDLVLGKQ